MLDFFASCSTTAAASEPDASAPAKNQPRISTHTFVSWHPDHMQDDHHHDHDHGGLELSLGLSSQPPSVQKARLISAASAGHLHQSREQIWQCLQHKENAFHEPASSRLAGDDCCPGFATETPHKGVSLYTRWPSVPLQFGSCNDLSRQFSATQLDLPLERDSESGQSLFQCEAQQLHRKKELQAFRRQEARKRRRSLMEEKQKKARNIDDHTGSSLQSDHFVAFELDKTSLFRNGSLQDFSKINNEETPQFACYVEQITGDNHPLGAKVHNHLFDSFTHGADKLKPQGKESSHGLSKFVRESMLGAAVQNNDGKAVSADQSAVEQYNMLSWGHKRACHTQTTPASTALSSTPHKVSNHLPLNTKTDYNDEYACNDDDEGDKHLNCRSTSENMAGSGNTRDAHSTSVQHDPMEHHEATSKKPSSTVTSIGGSATCNHKFPPIVMATNTTGTYAQFSVWPAIPYPGAMTGTVPLQWGFPYFMQYPVPTGENSTAASSSSVIGGHQSSSLEKSLSLFPLFPGGEPPPGYNNQCGSSKSGEPPARDSNQHGKPRAAGTAAEDEDKYPKSELTPPVMTVVQMTGRDKLLERAEPTLKGVEKSTRVASELLQSDSQRANDAPSRPLSRCSSAATQTQVNLPLEGREQPTEKQVMNRSSFNLNSQGHSSPSSTIESQSGGSCKDEKTHDEEAEGGRPDGSNWGLSGTSKCQEISKVESMPAIIAGKPAKDLPWVSTTGAGPQGKTITGIMYIDGAKRVCLICSCHGKHMSPTEFVQHSGSSDLSHPERSIKVSAVSTGIQLTATTG